MAAELAGVSELVGILGVNSRQRASQIARLPGFPEPVRLSCGPVWRVADVLRYMREPCWDVEAADDDGEHPFVRYAAENASGGTLREIFLNYLVNNATSARPMLPKDDEECVSVVVSAMESYMAARRHDGLQ